MELTKFTIKNSKSGRADVCFEFSHHNPVQFRCNHLVDTSTNLVDSLMSVWNVKKVAEVRFDLGRQGHLDLILISYPMGVLRAEFYEQVDWGMPEDMYAQKAPMAFLSFFTSWHAFTNTIVEGFTIQNVKTPDLFKHLEYKLPLLERKMKMGK